MHRVDWQDVLREMSEIQIFTTAIMTEKDNLIEF